MYIIIYYLREKKRHNTIFMMLITANNENENDFILYENIYMINMHGNEIKEHFYYIYSIYIYINAYTLYKQQ